MTALGLVDENEPVGGAVFDDYTGTNIFVHAALLRPTACRALMRAVGLYAFGQLNCSRLTLAAESTNLPAVELLKRLGAVLEGTLKGASRSGDDILLSRLERDCAIWRRISGQQ